MMRKTIIFTSAWYYYCYLIIKSCFVFVIEESDIQASHTALEKSGKSI